MKQATRLLIECLFAVMFLLVVVPRVGAAVDWSVRAANARTVMKEEAQLNRLYWEYWRITEKQTGHHRSLDDVTRRRDGR